MQRLLTIDVKKSQYHATTDTDSNAIPVPSVLVEDLELLTKTLGHLSSANAREREEKQQHHMCGCLVWDKLAACRRRSEVLLQQLATLLSKN